MAATDLYTVRLRTCTGAAVPSEIEEVFTLADGQAHVTSDLEGVTLMEAAVIGGGQEVRKAFTLSGRKTCIVARRDDNSVNFTWDHTFSDQGPDWIAAYCEAMG